MNFKWHDEVSSSGETSLPMIRSSLWPRDRLHSQRFRVRFPALPDFPGSSRSVTGSSQPREDKMRSYLNEKVAAPVQKAEIKGRRDALC
jgi:hypothetical protein